MQLLYFNTQESNFNSLATPRPTKSDSVKRQMKFQYQQKYKLSLGGSNPCRVPLFSTAERLLLWICSGRSFRQRFKAHAKARDGFGFMNNTNTHGIILGKSPHSKLQAQ